MEAGVRRRGPSLFIGLLLCIFTQPTQAQDAGIFDAAVLDAGITNTATTAATDTTTTTTATDTQAPAFPSEHLPVLNVTLTPDPNTPHSDHVMTGDLVVFELSATVPQGDDVNIPEQSFAPFEVLRKQTQTHTTTTTNNNTTPGHTQFVFRLALLALEPGDHTVGPLRVRVITQAGQIGFAQTAPVHILVGSVLGNEPDAQPKPATPPVEVMEDDPTLYWLGGILGTLLVGALLMWLVTRWWRKRVISAKPPPPPRPPWEVALERLDQLRTQRHRMVEQGTGQEWQEWVDALSDTLRQYLGDRYGFDGLESTSDEVLAHMKHMKLGAARWEEVATLLQDCDLVKFAEASVDAAQSETMLHTAYRVVNNAEGGQSPIRPVAPISPVTPTAPISEDVS